MTWIDEVVEVGEELNVMNIVHRLKAYKGRSQPMNTSVTTELKKCERYEFKGKELVKREVRENTHPSININPGNDFYQSHFTRSPIFKRLA